MDAAHDPRDLCDCCATELAEATRFNRPGLPSVSYRAGTHGSFLRRMIRRLDTEMVGGPPTPLRPTAGLRARDASDLSIALLDAWAMVADVLCFYEERIVNEAFIRTATERRSVLELARSIGYELRPGVAATTFLAFTVDPSASSPGPVTVPKGTKVQSVPGPGETSQTFETSEDLDAEAEFNAMRLATTEPWRPAKESKHVFLRGVQTGLKPGDGILFIGIERAGDPVSGRPEDPGSERWDFRQVATVAVHPAEGGEGYTEVTWDKALGWHRNGKEVLPPAPETMEVYALRLRVSVFGHNAPDWRRIPSNVRTNMPGGTGNDWPDLPLRFLHDQLDLDAVYPQIVLNSWVVLARPGWDEVYRVKGLEEHACTDFGLTAKTTQLTLSGELLVERFGNSRRDLTVFAQSERLEFAERPKEDPVGGDQILLDRVVDGLKPGQRIIVSAIPGSSGGATSEVATINRIEVAGGRTRIVVEDRLKNEYRWTTTVVNANVVAATHGETILDEVLGSGDAATPNQRFELKRRPLTYLTASAADGLESSLGVRIDDVLWPEAPSLFALDPQDRNCVVRLDNDGRTAVIFGDGRRGGRLPSGIENVKATYRYGSGPDGEVPKDRLTLMPMRPLGIREVTNPLAAEGSAPPESLANARTNAPRHVLTLGRAVSLQDYEDFARTFPGIGKAQATVLWNGENRFVYITAATAMGRPLTRESKLYGDLSDALDNEREPRESFALAGHTPRTFSLEAQILADPLYRTDRVFEAARTALTDAFSFGRREFGQGVSAAEVIATIQAVPGVRAVNVVRLAADDEPPTTPESGVPVVLRARLARFDGNAFQPAELLSVNPDGIQLSEMGP